MLIIINKICWAIATALIIMGGIHFTFKLKFVQFNIKEMIKSLKPNNNKKEISSFKSLLLALGGRLGVGSIAGVALAIHLGGAGTIFWMWIIAFISGANTFAENVLASIYKEKDTSNVNKGGPSYYIKKGLGYKKLGSLYAILIIIGYVFGVSAIQANAISRSINTIVVFNPLIIGIILSLIIGIIIIGGIKKISSIISKIVPFMTVLYLLCSLYVIFKNHQTIMNILITIVQEAFKIKPFLGGFLMNVIIGIQRGIFSNESGVGTSAIVSSTTKGKDAARQGYTQILGVYITSLLICTATALIILTTNYNTINFENINGVEIIQYAFVFHFGNIGNYILLLSLFLFTFSTIITAYYYGESSLKYFYKKLKIKHLFLIKALTIITVILGAIMPPSILWDIVDLIVALLVIINMSALILLRNDVNLELNYFKLRNYGKI